MQIIWMNTVNRSFYLQRINVIIFLAVYYCIKILILDRNIMNHVDAYN